VLVVVGLYQAGLLCTIRASEDTRIQVSGEKSCALPERVTSGEKSRALPQRVASSLVVYSW
jgi:hypothetical protein